MKAQGLGRFRNREGPQDPQIVGIVTRKRTTRRVLLR
jgi:hypothetical protein